MARRRGEPSGDARRRPAGPGRATAPHGSASASARQAAAVARPLLRVVADREAGDLRLGRVGDHRRCGRRRSARRSSSRPSPLLRRPVRLVAAVDERVRDRRAGDDRGVVGHRPGDAQLACPRGSSPSPWWAESSRYSSRGSFCAASPTGSSAIRSGRSCSQVVLDEAVQERELEVDVRSSGASAIGRTAALMSGQPTRRAPRRCRSASAPAACARRRPRTSDRPSSRRSAGRRAACRPCRCSRGRSACRRASSCSRAAGRRTRSCRRSRPSRVSITWTLRAVEADTSRRRPSGEIAMWSAR